MLRIEGFASGAAPQPIIFVDVPWSFPYLYFCASRPRLRPQEGSNPRLAELFHLPAVEGVLVVDPGINSERLNIGRLQRGDQFWLVGEKNVKDFGEFKRRLSAAFQGPESKQGVRVVYYFRRAEFAGPMSNTQHLKLNDAEVAALLR